MISLPFFTDIVVSPRRSSFYTFSKALKDFDKSVTEGTKFYLSRMMCLNLPLWEQDKMYFKFRKSTSLNPGDIVYFKEVEGDVNFPTGIELEASTLDYVNPNMVIPRVFMAYMENIIRQTNVLTGGGSPKEIAELAFWKTLNFMGIPLPDIFGDNPTVITFTNSLAVSNFIEVSNNQGWQEVVGAIPNKCNLLQLDSTKWKTIDGINDVVSCDVNEDTAIYDGNPGSSFTLNFTDFKKVIDWDLLTFDDSVDTSFKFNTLLLFYKDADDVEKLYGINFIYPFDVSDGLGYNWQQQTFTHLTNQIQSFGFSFKFNIKSNNNTATKNEIYTLQEGSFWDTFEETLSLFNSFFEQQRNRGEII